MVTDRDLNLMATAGLADDVRRAAKGLYGENLSSPRDDVGRMVAELDRLRRERAELLDRIHGTPCAQIRWQQEREEFQADNERLRAALIEIDFICLALIAVGFHHKNILEVHQMASAVLDGQPAPRKGE